MERDGVKLLRPCALGLPSLYLNGTGRDGVQQLSHVSLKLSPLLNGVEIRTRYSVFMTEGNLVFEWNA